jgi:hypothetical protein
LVACPSEVTNVTVGDKTVSQQVSFLVPDKRRERHSLPPIS